jgi:hypothetical protein
MINKLLTRGSLLFLLGLLLVARFIFIPLVEWQENRVAVIEVKARQLDKIATLIDGAAANEEMLVRSQENFSALRGSLFADEDGVKLGLQQSIRSIFSKQKVTMSSFEWSHDEFTGPLRTLKATVLFHGNTEGMILSFMQLRTATKVVKISEWNQRFTQTAPGRLGTTRGSMVVEFYAIGPGESLITSGVQNTPGEGSRSE